MTGEELKIYIKQSGLTMTDIAKEMGTTPQNIQARLSRKTLKADFVQTITSIIDKCAHLPANIEPSVAGSNINGSNSSNVRQTIASGNDALIRENEVLRQQNQFQQKQIEAQQKQIETLLALVGKM